MAFDIRLRERGASAYVLHMPFDFQAAYDQLNADDHDYRFYAELSKQLRAGHALDLGCGTGRLARLLATSGTSVVAIDPDPDMLRVACSKVGAEKVDWRQGYSDQADTCSSDLAVMSGHVAQVFVEDEAWSAALQDLYRALVPGGTLAFETRNPQARGWERWTREATLRTVNSGEGPTEFWHATVDVDLPLVTYDTFTRNLASRAETCSRNVLTFRDVEELDRSLDDTGFEIVSVFGDWDRAPVTATSPEIIVIARRR